MASLREWMARRSGPEIFVINALYFGVAFWLLGLATGQHYNLVALSVGGILFGALMTVLTLRSRRRSGGGELLVAIGAAIRSGELPLIYDRALWLNQLEQRLAALRRALVVNPIWFGLIIVLGVLTALISPRVDTGLLIISALVTGLGVAFVVSTRRRIPKILALQRAIQADYVPPVPTETAS